MAPGRLTRGIHKGMVSPMHQRREKQSLALHRRIAERLLDDPTAVIGKAVENLKRWENASPHGLSPACLEWREILTRRAPAEIAERIVADDEDAARLRQSSPFAGVLDPREVWAIKRGHEAA